jgi:hypothetical protein
MSLALNVLRVIPGWTSRCRESFQLACSWSPWRLVCMQFCSYLFNWDKLTGSLVKIITSPLLRQNLHFLSAVHELKPAVHCHLPGLPSRLFHLCYVIMLDGRNSPLHRQNLHFIRWQGIQPALNSHLPGPPHRSTEAKASLTPLIFCHTLFQSCGSGMIFSGSGSDFPDGFESCMNFFWYF